MSLINGHKQNHLVANDRATQFGDGSFTTAQIINGRICLHEAHLLRLQEACDKLFIPFTQWDILKKEMCILSEKVSRGIVKVIISRGSGGCGYSIDNCLKPNRILSVLPYPSYYDKWRHLGITLTQSPVHLGRNPMLAGIKHLNRLEQVLISTYCKKSGADEALVLDSEGIITECCTANLFWRKGYNVFTPCLDYAGVNGVMRKFCLEKLKNSPFRVIEVSVGPQALHHADEVVICNSIMPIIPVRAYADKVWTSRKLYQFLSSVM